MSEPWIKRKHPLYDELLRRAVYALDHYTGEAREKVERDASTLARRTTSRIDKDADLSALPKAILETRQQRAARRRSGVYLVQKAQGEHDDAFTERAYLSRFPRYMRRVIGSFVGSVEMVSRRDERVWEGSAVGSPVDEGSPMSRLWKDADGAGTNWLNLITEQASMLCVLPHIGYFVQPPETPDQDARVVIFDVGDVTNWYRDKRGRLQWIIVREGHVDRSDPTIEPLEAAHERYMLINEEGVFRYSISEDGKDIAFLEGESIVWDTPFYTTSERKEQRLPVGFAVLDPDIGYMVARDNNYLYNMLSDVRNNIRSVTHNKLAGDVDDNQYQNTLTKLLEGWNVLQGDWKYIGPSPDYTTAVWQVYKDEVRDFFITAFQAYEDVARERTATEIMQDQTAGRFSFLSLLVAILDEMENDWLFLMEQIYMPSRPDAWGQAKVKRSRNFKPIDPVLEAERLMVALFGANVPPMPASAYAAGLQRVFDSFALGVSGEDANRYGEILAALKIMQARDGMGADQALSIARGQTALLGRTDFTNGIEQ